MIKGRICSGPFFMDAPKEEAGTDCSGRLRVLKPGELGCADGASRAGVDTGTAVDARVSVKFVLVTGRGDGVHRAGIDTGTAVSTVIGNNVSHWSYLLVKVFGLSQIICIHIMGACESPVERCCLRIGVHKKT